MMPINVNISRLKRNKLQRPKVPALQTTRKLYFVS